MSLSHIWCTCTRGHCWQAEGASGSRDTRHCPVCGQTGETMVDAASLTRELSAADELPPPPGRAHAPTRVERKVESADDDDWQELLAPAEQPDELGRLGGYRVLRVLGAGGMGTVFEAEDTRLVRRVALKVMRPGFAATSTAHSRFLREARAAASLEHDHVVTVYEVGEDRGIPFLAMQLLRGESLRERIAREGTLPVAEVLRIGRETAIGLAEAHARHLYHRDIKPDNIWLQTKDEGRRMKDEGEALREERPPGSSFSLQPSSFRVKILDFGLARFGDDELRLTKRGQIMGTLHFMAPEQVGGEGVDHRCDLFSLGCVMYYLATGCLPFANTGAKSVLLALTCDTPQSPREVNPSVPSTVSVLVMKLLEKDPAARYQTAVEVVMAIEDLERKGLDAAAAPVAPPSQDGKSNGSSQRRVWMALAVLTLLIGAAVLVWLFAG